jgi:hypothetical protein
LACAGLAGCGSSGGGVVAPDSGPSSQPDGGSPEAASFPDSGTRDGTSSVESGTPDATSEAATDGAAATCGTCPMGYTCGTANGLHVCRSATGIPLFSNVFVILMENTSLSTLTPAMQNGTAPNLAMLASKYATGTNYHGVSHPSLPNYVALTSGGLQGIGCDCEAQTSAGACNSLNCNLLLGSCSCVVSTTNLADQLEGANLSWMDFGEDMSTPCNLTDSGNYAVRHNPFLYYSDIQSNATRCNAHVVDFTMFDASSPARFNYIAPNLIDDMHNPDPTNSTNIPDGDMWIGPHVASILSSSGYTQGGLLVVVWDEDDGSGGITGTDDPIPIFVMSPYAKSGGYMSATMANHYSLLATFQDGLGLARLGSSATAMPLADYFPAQ